MPEQKDNVLTTVDKAFKIIKHLKEEGGKTVTELADDFDMPPSTTQMYLNTLYTNDFIVKEEGRYKIGLQFLEYGTFSLWNEPIFPVIKPKIDELAEESGELAACFVEEEGEVVYIYGSEGDQAVRTDLSIGDRSKIHCTASGKAMLAHQPEDRINEIISKHGLRSKTEHTITDPQELRDELEKIRKQGYARSEQESVEGLNVVAAPVLIHDEVVGAINLAGPATRFTSERFEEELPQLVKGVANEIELKLMYSDRRIS